MKIIVNGEVRSYKGKVTVAALIRKIGAQRGRVAVVVNGEVVGRDEVASRNLKDNDRVEILTYAAGG
ncbi:MAG: sulfur carrier protein ThiS [bacterium]